MRLVEEDKMFGIRAMFATAGRGKDYGLDAYPICHTKYMGTGHHMYFLSREGDYAKASGVIDKRWHPGHIANLLAGSVDDFKIVVIDVEIGGMYVWDRNGMCSRGDVSC